MYGGDSSGSDSDSDSDRGGRRPGDGGGGGGSDSEDSDAELEAAIRRRRQEFALREREIMARLQAEQPPEHEQGGGGEHSAPNGERRHDAGWPAASASTVTNTVTDR